MPMWFLPQIEKVIHDTDMAIILQAVFEVAGGKGKEARAVASHLAKTLKQYDNEQCWKDIIKVSPIAADVCDAIVRIQKG